MTIATVINYCTNDYRFLARAIDEVSPFSSQIIVPVCDHFFDGTPENRFLLETSYTEHPHALFLEFAFDPKELYTPYVRRTPTDDDWGALWHSTARYLSFLHLDDSIEYLLFLDADEIVEGKRFNDWLQKEEYQRWDALWFFAHCYGFLPSKRSSQIQQTALLVKRSAISPLKILSAQERFGLLSGLSGAKRLQIMGLDGHPMIHHYSWVRSPEERLHKSRTWGKKHLCNWAEWLESPPEENSYVEVIPYFDPMAVSIPSTLEKQEGEEIGFKNVIRVDRNIAFRKELELLF
jgi:hypothetical protein